eukprot:SAG11_NODE_585_length_8349_cov_38.121939_5_plen_69_part_00
MKRRAICCINNSKPKTFQGLANLLQSETDGEGELKSWDAGASYNDTDVAHFKYREPFDFVSVSVVSVV